VNDSNLPVYWMTRHGVEIKMGHLAELTVKSWIENPQPVKSHL